MDIKEMKVGGQFDAARNQPEGAYLLIDASGIMLWLNYRNPTEKEIMHWTKPGKIEFRTVVKNKLFFMLVKVDGENWIDVPYCPQISDSYELDPITDDALGYSLTIFMTDQYTAEIKGVRLVGLQNKFSRRMKQELDALMHENPNLTPGEYYTKLNGIYASYSTQDLLSYSQR